MKKKDAHGIALAVAAFVFSIAICYVLISISGMEKTDPQSQKTTFVRCYYEEPKKEGVAGGVDNNMKYDSRFANSRLKTANKAVKLNTGSETGSVTKVVEMPADLIPVNYTRIELNLEPFIVYGFVDSNGKTQYRLPVCRESYAGMIYGYVAVEYQISGTNIGYSYDLDSKMLFPEEESFGVLEKAVAPQTALSANIRPVYGEPGLYYMNDHGVVKYYVYGHYRNWNDNFYEADSNGVAIPGKIHITL